jgi:P27 family predicted phage terminase small subunit
MALPGPKPKPTRLRLLDGGAGHRPLNPDEPKPAPLALEPPERLTDAQKEIWRETLAVTPPGMLTSLDAELLSKYVVALSWHRTMERMVNDYGTLVKIPGAEKTDPAPLPVYSPAYCQWRTLARDIVKYAAELGFSPTSRTRVKVDRSTKKQSPFGELKEFGD